MVFPSTSTKKTRNVNTNYLETLQQCTKTVTDLYTKYVARFPQEYIALASKTSVPNGTILRIPKKQSGNEITIKFMKYKKCSDLTDDEVFELVNAWVYLEEGQSPLNYLDMYFKYIINHFGITKYRLKQMYQDLELDEEDDYAADPDYNPDLDTEDYREELENTEGSEDELNDSYSHVTSDESSGSGDTLNLENTEFEFKHPCNDADNEDDDSDKSPDYVPSVESEDEYENTHRNIVVTKRRKTRKTRKPSKTVH
jgi:hypothetical protein